MTIVCGMDEQPANPSLDRRHADLAFAASVVFGVLIWAVVYLWFPGVATMLFLGAILAYALLPLVDWLHRKHVPRVAGVLLVALVGAGLIALIVVLMAPAVALQIAELPEMVRETWSQIRGVWDGLRDRIPANLADDVERFSSSLEQRAQDALPGASTLTDWASRAASGVGTVASAIVFVPIFVFLMLRGYHRFVDRSADLVPPRWRDRFFERSTQADEVLSGFIRGQLLVAVITGALYALAFTIIGVPLALVVGLLAGLGELVPFLGGAIALVLASLLALAGGNPIDVLWVVVAFAAVQTLEGALISPWIMGRKVQLGPSIVIVALAVGSQLFGFIGLLAAVPIAAVLKVAARAAIDAYRASPFFLRRHAP